MSDLTLAQIKEIKAAMDRRLQAVVSKEASEFYRATKVYVSGFKTEFISLEGLKPGGEEHVLTKFSTVIDY